MTDTLDGTEPAGPAPLPEPEPVGTLNAITAALAGLAPLESWEQLSVDARRRVAMLERGGQPVGTGVLVGPDVLLTAGHVIGLVGPVSAPASAAAAADLMAVFDFRPTPGRSPAETGVRVPVSELLDGSPPSAAELGETPPIAEPGPDRLDFALLRLAYAAPAAQESGTAAARGHYAMAAGAYKFGAQSFFLIFQHPLGNGLHVSRALGAKSNAAATRFRYTANTMDGSSGSPVIDARGLLVGIHHYYVAGLNQAVPVSAIARAVAEGPHPEILLPQAPAAPASLPDQASVQAVPYLPGDDVRLAKLGKYIEIVDSLYALAEGGDNAAVSRLAVLLQRRGRFIDAAKLVAVHRTGDRAALRAHLQHVRKG